MSIRFLSIAFCLTLCVPATVCGARRRPCQPSGPNRKKRNTGDFVVGYRFTLDKAMSVTALGVTDQNKDGQTQRTEAGQDGHLGRRGQAVRHRRSAGDRDRRQRHFFVAIEPVKLDAGRYVMGEVTHKGGEGFLLYDSPIEAVPGVRWDEGRFELGAAIIFPQQKRMPASSYFGPVFKVLANAVTAVKPSSSLRVTQPAERAVFQRDEHGGAEVPVAVTLADEQADAVEVRALDRQTKLPAKDWAKVTTGMELTLPAGWYQLEFRQ